MRKAFQHCPSEQRPGLWPLCPSWPPLPDHMRDDRAQVCVRLSDQLPPSPDQALRSREMGSDSKCQESLSLCHLDFQADAAGAEQMRRFRDTPVPAGAACAELRPGRTPCHPTPPSNRPPCPRPCTPVSSHSPALARNHLLYRQIWLLHTQPQAGGLIFTHHQDCLLKRNDLPRYFLKITSVGVPWWSSG